MPDSPEILAWLETLPLTVRLTTLHAMSIAFPQLQRSQEWKATNRQGAATARELGDILREAARHAERLKAELAG
jgi:hypothetical protein